MEAVLDRESLWGYKIEEEEEEEDETYFRVTSVPIWWLIGILDLQLTALLEKCAIVSIIL